MNSFEKEPDEGLIWIYWSQKSEPLKSLVYWKNGEARDMHTGMMELDYITRTKVGWEAYK